MGLISEYSPAQLEFRWETGDGRWEMGGSNGELTYTARY
jgi:hypothetical protein